ncbi:hypothetical protein DL546_000565 [Coniochaeta pulveracea]|uniref:DNA repair protein Rad26 n=1 Tax=Coniochaeta pulveracea TaxID=177199 RepID=A0A420XW09_9PEZI|nr:hypothetical protein DL546_000565 [Coniochaeta pulveracea]
MDDYSDDGLDDLNDTVLQELENNAIQFTQAQQQSQVFRPPPRPLPPRVSTSHIDLTGFEEDDLDDAVVEDELAKQPTVVAPNAVDRPLPPQQARAFPAVGRPQPAWQQRQQQGQKPQQGVRPGPPQPQASWQQRPQQPSQFNHQQQPRWQQSQRPVPSFNRPAALVDRTAPSQRYPARPVPPQRLGEDYTQPGNATQYNRVQQPSLPGGRPILQHPAQASQVARVIAGPGATSGAGDPTEIIAQLQAQISALASEVTSAKGEASIVRSKFEKALSTHEQEVARLKRQNAEQLAKQEQTVQAALAAKENATTELEFARQDLEATLGRTKSKRKDGKTGKDILSTTPKKKTKWTVGDGFDDVELLPSPGRAKRKESGGGVAGPFSALERTPTKGKRKRPAVDSPAMALEVHEDTPMPDAPEVAAIGLKATGGKKAGALEKEPFKSRSDVLMPFDFLKLILDHSPAHGQPLTFDLFSRYAFPSDPNHSLAAIILDKLPELGQGRDRLPEQQAVHLLVDFCELVLDMWSQCLNEKYFTPVHDIASLVSFALQLNTMAIVPHIIPGLLPLLQTTCILIALPRFESPDGDLSTHLNGSLRQLSTEINVTQSLSLLYLAALASVGPSPGYHTPVDESGTDGNSSPFRTQKEFWKHIQLEFVLIMLSPKQPEEDFLGMLSLLCTSVLPDSIGPIPNPSLELLPPQLRQDDQSLEFAARSLINRISGYLPNPPNWAPRNSVKQCRVQLAILRTLLAFARSPFGALQMAASAYLIPRMVVVLCWAIDKLYDMDVPPSLLQWKLNGVQNGRDEESELGKGNGDPDATQDAASFKTRHGDMTTLLNQLIAQITALLHYLITDPRTANVVNLPAKLAASHGGAYRYQITLARLTFAEEDLVLEAGIDSRTVELAHELLELAVTPDEGEGVAEVFVPQP